MRGKQAFDVLQILRPPGNGLHDEQIFDAGQAYTQPADIVNLAVVDRRLFEQQPAERNVYVDTGLHMPHQKDATSACELKRVLDSGKDPVTGCDGYRAGPFCFGKNRESIDILGQARTT